MLGHYLEAQPDGWVADLHRVLGGFAEAAGTGRDRFTVALFGGVLGSLYAALQFVAAPLWGALSDRWGRRPVLLLTCAGTALSYVVWFFAGTFELLLVARLLGGAFAGNISVASAAVADCTPRERRAQGMALVGAAFGLGFILGPAVGALAALWNPLVHAPGLAAWGVNPFSGAALVALVLSLVNLAQVARSLPETLPAGARAEPRGLAASWRGTSPGTRRTLAAFFTYSAAFSGMEFTLTFLAALRFGFSPGQLAGMLVFVGLLLVLTQGVLVRRLVPRLGERRGARLGLAGVATGLAVLAWAPSAPWLFVALAFLSVGAGFANACLSALASLYAPADAQGAALGAFRSLGSLARAVSPFAASTLFWWSGQGPTYAAGAVVVVLAWALTWRLPGTGSRGAGA